MKFYIVVEKGFSREYYFPTYPHGYKPAREMEGYIFEINLEDWPEVLTEAQYQAGTSFIPFRMYKVKLVEVRYGVGHPEYREVLRVSTSDSPYTPQDNEHD